MFSKKDRKAERVQVRRRVRGKVFGTAERPRLAVFRSTKHMYAQVIDDLAGVTLAAASTTESECREKLGEGNKSAGAKLVGELIGRRLQEKGVKSVVFDRGGFRFHGRVKAVADGARESGLQF